MVATALQSEEATEYPDVSHIVTEDDEPVDNFLSEKQQRLLVAPLYASWEGPPPDEDGRPRTFLASANVGLFPTPTNDPLVPDAFVSLDVTLHEDLWAKRHRTYFFWEMGKPPDVVIEVVSNREGGELDRKKRRYAKMRIPYYVVFDPGHHLGPTTLRAFELRGDLYVAVEPWFESLGLRLVEWTGEFEGYTYGWLRWARRDGTLLRTGEERAESEKQRAESEKQRAESEKQRAERLAEKLRALGVDPDEV
jgi:Uma2 family endonuclease